MKMLRIFRYYLRSKFRRKIGSIRRQKCSVCALVTWVTSFSLLIYCKYTIHQMETRLALVQENIKSSESSYWARLNEVLNLQRKLLINRSSTSGSSDYLSKFRANEVIARTTLHNGSRQAGQEGIDSSGKPMPLFHDKFVRQLIPHLIKDPSSLRPAYHLKSSRQSVEMVIGIPSVKRDVSSYLITTLEHLINGLSDKDKTSLLVIIFIGETDLLYVLQIAFSIKKRFPLEMQQGLFEVIAPTASYYPDFKSYQPNHNDSMKRFIWRTKQNLDILYLMAFSQSRGTYYLMLEDDVISQKNYMTDIKLYRTEMILRNPDLFFIQYCPYGGIGKLFRARDLLRFIIFIQIVYDRTPVDWNLNKYVYDKTCFDTDTEFQCISAMSDCRPTYNKQIFKHRGFISSLVGKFQMLGVVMKDDLSIILQLNEIIRKKQREKQEERVI